MKTKMTNIWTITLIPENSAETAILNNIAKNEKIHIYNMWNLSKDWFTIIQTPEFYNK